MKYNKGQELAIAAKEGSLVLAVPGSGKTSVLTRRIRRLLMDNVPPHEILALTFSNEAAREIEHRIGSKSGGLGSGVKCGTFHSFAANSLRQMLKHEGDDEIVTIDGRVWDSSFTISDEVDYRALLNEVCAGFGILKNDVPYYAETVGKMKNEGWKIDPNRSDRSYSKLVTDIFERSLSLASDSNVMSYDDLLWCCAKLLKEDPCQREFLRYGIRHVMVDEIQDTNRVQLDIISSIIFGDECPADFEWDDRELNQQRSLFLVGDLNQSIYAWRGANPALIESLPHEWGLKVLRLELNYRSVPTICQVADRLISNNSDSLKTTIEPVRSDLTWEEVLTAKRETTGETDRKTEGETTENKFNIPDRAVTFKWLPGEMEESSSVLNSILAIQESGAYDLKDIAILYRTNAQSRTLEAALAGASVPHQVIGAFQFFKRKEIIETLGYLSFCLNTKDDQVFKRIVNIPRRHIGGVSIATLSVLATSLKKSMFQTAKENMDDLKIAPASKAGFQDFILAIERLQEMLKEGLQEDTIARAVETSGYQKHLDGLIEEERSERMGNLAELQNAIDVHRMGTPNATFQSFIQSIAFLEIESKEKKGTDFVSLMTCHKAKGREFPIVFLVGMEEGTFPSNRAMEAEGVEEERKLAYVGITRAKDFLFMSGAALRRNELTSPSRFVTEMSKVDK